MVVSRLFGAGDRKGVKRAVTTAFVSSLGLAAVLTVFGYFFSSNMMEWIHTPQNIMGRWNFVSQNICIRYDFSDAL